MSYKEDESTIESKNTKEATFLKIAVSLQERQAEYTRGMDAYIERLKNQEPDTARENAMRALVRTGVVTRNGNPKKKIVSWE